MNDGLTHFVGDTCEGGHKLGKQPALSNVREPSLERSCPNAVSWCNGPDLPGDICNTCLMTWTDEAKEKSWNYDESDDMCPNCVTPWKCNGPHLHEQTRAWAANQHEGGLSE